jgi:hypothetical protein
METNYIFRRLQTLAYLERHAFDFLKKLILLNFFFFSTKNVDTFIFVAETRTLNSEDITSSVDYGFLGTATSSYPFTTYDWLIILSKTKPYTQWQKIYFPFEFDVWIWLLITYCVGFCVISVIKKMPIYVQHFVFGLKVKNPILNFM